jgi:hypothetical protein
MTERIFTRERARRRRRQIRRASLIALMLVGIAGWGVARADLLAPPLVEAVAPGLASAHALIFWAAIALIAVLSMTALWSVAAARRR